MKSAPAFLTSLAALCVLLLTACGSGDEQKQSAGSSSEQIAIDGSSTVFPLAEAAAEGFTRTARGGARVTVGESGTGGGFRKFCRGETQISNASRPISRRPTSSTWKSRSRSTASASSSIRAIP
jgi:phosphate transport system substrate-binding protein